VAYKKGENLPVFKGLFTVEDFITMWRDASKWSRLEVTVSQ